jgi:hypothetical protein
LAAELGFDSGLSLTPADLWPERSLLLLWDLEFRWQRLVGRFQVALMPPIQKLRRGLGQLARRCGLNPRERSARRTRS